MKKVYLERWFEYLHTFPKWKLTFWTLGGMFIIFILEVIIHIFGDSSNTESSEDTTIKTFFIGFVGPVIIAPIGETLLFQTFFLE